MKRRNVRTLSLIVVTFTYLLVGAAVFDALEGQHNENALEALNLMKSNFKLKYNMSEDEYKIIEVLIIERKPHLNGPQWKFAGSFYYALVVLALIGYGHSTPNTPLGKAFTMGYASLGIPMAMVMFQSMGERMNKAFSVIIQQIKKWIGCNRTEASEFDLILASGVTSTIVITSGAIMYHTEEGWSFFDSVYYSFITLSTIGFGDFVALQNGRALQLRPGYVVCSFVFLLLGLAALSSSINLLVLRFMILSLEEEEQEELQDVSQNVVTLDGEVMAVNGRILAGHSAANGRSLLAIGIEPETSSVCSCTCYGGNTRTGGMAAIEQRMNSRRGRERRRAAAGYHPSRIEPGWNTKKSKLWTRVLIWMGFFDQDDQSDDSNFFNEETQSINTYAKHAVKRSSF